MDPVAQRRLAITQRHLFPEGEDSLLAGELASLHAADVSATATAPLDLKSLAVATAPHYREYRNQLYKLFQEPLFRTNYDLSLEGWRELTVRRVKRVCETGLVDVRDHKRDPLRLVTALECLTDLDASLGVKCGVHFTLFGGAIMHLGTERHEKQFADAINSWAAPGSFAMTELGHGSNVQGVETVATYDKATQEFVIKTPSDSAQKCWIGNAACHGQWTACFAQLVINGENQGVHAFVVRLRNADGTVVPNVRIADNGHKMGLLGVDNGRIWFDNTRVPREALLNRFADVDAAGNYTSPIKSKVKRFAAMVAPLVGGRVMVGDGANHISEIASTIAIRYAHQRRQFDDGSGMERRIIDYVTHQRRLYPALAGAYGYAFAFNRLKELYAKKDQTANDIKNVHVLASGLKAMATWHKTVTLQQTRECCGGQGFSTYNRIGVMKSDSEVDLTYEGDNTVLMQQVTRSLLSDMQKGRIPDVEPLQGGADKTTCVHALLQALKWREVFLLKRVMGAVAAGMGEGKTMLQAWNATLDLGVAAGIAHIDRVVVEDMLAVAEHPKNGSIKDVVLLLARLHALSRVRNDLGTFAANGGVSLEFARAVDDAINAACAEVHPLSLALTEAFEYPLHILRAPIAGDYVALHAYDISRHGPASLC